MKNPKCAMRREQIAERRAAFARAMARSVLGRHYWDERQEKELRRALSGRRKTGGGTP